MSGYLLDTHTLLWLQLDSPTLKKGVRQTLALAPMFVSVASIAEIAIKAAAGKLPLPAPFHTDFATAVRAMLNEGSIDLLPLDLPTVIRLRHLPRYHNDPFDRMIISQALELGLTVATRDKVFAAYAGLDILDV